MGDVCQAESGSTALPGLRMEPIPDTRASTRARAGDRMDCPGCCRALDRARRTGQWESCPVPNCRAQWQAPRTDRPARTVRPPPAEHHRVGSFVLQVLQWNASVLRVERAAFGDRSSNWAMVQRFAELGVLGHGCAGTRGVGRAPSHEADTRNADPVLTARYQSLRGADLRTADAVIADGQGEILVPVACGARTVECTLAERVGFLLAAQRQAIRWHAKIASGDARPALAGAREYGEALLTASAKAWFSQ
jgi:hypothetical protein